MERFESVVGPDPDFRPGQATVLKCDVVSSKPLDFESQLALVRNFARVVTGIATRYGARIEPFEGASATMVLGFPQSRQTAAESAARGGLDLVDAMRSVEIGPGIQAQVRVGIASGMTALIRRPSGEFLAGLAIDSADQLKALAEPGELVIADDTKRLAANIFNDDRLGIVEVPGLGEWFRAWQVITLKLLGWPFQKQGVPVSAGITTTSVHFPGPDDFDGEFDESNTPATLGGQSTYDGSIAVTLLNRSLVESVLPTGFNLAGRKDGGHEHPVIHLIGHQRDLMGLAAGIPVPSGDPDYQEMILLIPFVVKGAGTKWHSFSVRMYLDDPIAIGIGNSTYAYAKKTASLPETGTPNDMTTKVKLSGSVYFSTECTLTGPWRTSDDAKTSVPRWPDLQKIFAMPLVGIDVVSGYVVRSVCSYWEWDYTNAEVAPATSQHQFYKSLRQGMNGWVALGPLSSAPDGSVAVRGIRWRIPFPPRPARSKSPETSF